MDREGIQAQLLELRYDKKNKYSDYAKLFAACWPVITSTESPATFCTFLHSRAWSWPISTMSKPEHCGLRPARHSPGICHPSARRPARHGTYRLQYRDAPFRGLSSSTCGRSLPCRQNGVPATDSQRATPEWRRYHAENGNLHSVALQHLVGPEVGFARSGIDDVAPSTGARQSPAQRSKTARPVSTSWFATIGGSHSP